MWKRSVTLARTQFAALDTEEVFNSITHGLGLAAASLGALSLVIVAAWGGDPWRVLGAAVFGGSLVFLYGASTAYHGTVGALWKARLRRVDHFGIKLLIAGSYTPFVLTFMRHSPGFWMGVTVWALLFLGLLLQFLLPEERYYQASLVLYLAMGFACLPFIHAMTSTLPPGALTMLAIGGGLYVAGVGFFVWESLPFAHGIWHLFVLGGSGVHFMAVLRYAVLG